MICQLFILFGVLISYSVPKNSETIIEGYLLCKYCGNDNSVLNLIINNRISEQATSVSNITIGTKAITIQELINPLGITFKVIITKRANCAKLSGNNWYTGGSWFNGFGWKICQCPSCKNHLGWMFEEIDTIVNKNPIFPSDKGFYGIILDSVISESYADSLLMIDKVLRH